VTKKDIYGPFEAGFGEAQENIIKSLGCTDPTLGYLDGGIDTLTAEKKVSFACDVTLPRVENGKWIGMLDECGGHTKDYHNHEKLICLYDATAEGHSSRVGTAANSKGIYDKWEATGVKPELDACGGKCEEKNMYTRTYAHAHAQVCKTRTPARKLDLR
jgi:hypothetical protein